MTTKSPAPNLEILFVDDDPYFRLAFCKKLEGLATINECDGFESAILALNKDKNYELAIIDLTLHGKILGFDLLKMAKAKGFCAIILTDHDDQELIDLAYTNGADLYITKDQGLAAIEKIVKDRIQSRESLYSYLLSSSQAITTKFLEQKLLTQDKGLLTEIKMLDARIKNVQTILLVGEDGVGKSTLAQYIHAICSEPQSKLITVDLSSFSSPEQIDKISKALKKGETLLIKNINYLTLKQQNRLEQLLSIAHLKSKIIATSSDDLLVLIKEGNFSISLFHKISSITVTIPPLNHRRSDVALIIDHLLKNDSRKIQLRKEVKESLSKYNWPKNVTELKIVIEGLLSLNKGIIELADLPSNITGNFNPYLLEASSKPFLTTEQFNYAKTHGLKSLVEKVEEDTIREIMSVNSMPTKAVKLLKTSLATFYRILKRLESSETNSSNNTIKPIRSKYAEKYYKKENLQ
ncbi:MAG: response regulator [Oligoflexia bacterium]|nr:response regulator [Oligoflexia bacterium]